MRLWSRSEGPSKKKVGVKEHWSVADTSLSSSSIPICFLLQGTSPIFLSLLLVPSFSLPFGLAASVKDPGGHSVCNTLCIPLKPAIQYILSPFSCEILSRLASLWRTACHEPSDTWWTRRESRQQASEMGDSTSSSSTGVTDEVLRKFFVDFMRRRCMYRCGLARESLFADDHFMTR